MKNSKNEKQNQQETKSLKIKFKQEKLNKNKQVNFGGEDNGLKKFAGLLIEDLIKEFRGKFLLFVGQFKNAPYLDGKAYKHELSLSRIK